MGTIAIGICSKSKTRIVFRKGWISNAFICRDPEMMSSCGTSKEGWGEEEVIKTVWES